MKMLATALTISIVMIFSFNAHAEQTEKEKAMHDLHSLGDRMLHVIEEGEKLHGEALKEKIKCEEKKDEISYL